MVNEEVLRNAMNVNICMILNDIIGPDYEYSMRQPDAPGEPDFTCHYLVESLILVIKVKRKHVLENINRRTFPEFYQANEKARMVIQQIYNYMGEIKRRYGVLATHDNHWFLLSTPRAYRALDLKNSSTTVSIPTCTQGIRLYNLIGER